MVRAAIGPVHAQGTTLKEIGLEWSDLETIEKIIEIFPMPVAVLDEMGAPLLLSDAFRLRFGPEALSWPSIREILDGRAGGWTTIHRPGDADGLDLLLARSVRVNGVQTLVIDDGASPDLLKKVDDLQTQVGALRKLSSTDALTGAWNRAHFERIIESEVNRSLRFRQPVSLIFLDVDHFKTINDTFGHAAGDAVLRELVRVIGSATRASDMLFRWGGDEFVILTPQTGYRQAAGLAEKVAGVVAGKPLTEVGPVRISLGVAEFSGDESHEVWLGRADAALYRAKQSGRGRVAVDERGASDAWAAQSGLSAVRLVWQEAYECGEARIDRQHRELFDLGNRLFEAATAEPRSAGDVATALDSLLAHIVTHFADEEAILAEQGYADFAAHKRAHARLLERAMTLKAAVAEGRSGLGDLVEFLGNAVIAQHLFKADRAYFPLFANAASVDPHQPAGSTDPVRRPDDSLGAVK